jgi:hypothetical protein
MRQSRLQQEAEDEYMAEMQRIRDEEIKANEEASRKEYLARMATVQEQPVLQIGARSSLAQSEPTPLLAGQRPKPSPRSNYYQMHYGMKDYSKETNINGWGSKNQFGEDMQMGAVALQAQGYSLPPRPAPPI